MKICRTFCKHATEMLYRWLQVKLFHFSATSQASLSNLDEEEYFNNIEKSLSPVSFTIYFNVMLIECILTLYYLYSVNKSRSRKTEITSETATNNLSFYFFKFVKIMQLFYAVSDTTRDELHLVFISFSY
ncbi:hypothetical protein Avbf_05865 [Armadillidium vulgare]|nr:hypothetical protein Avbf_05865 [Armadillidium vulgare]